jgi:transcriptional regulator with XRE-family HTH domain
MQQQRIDQNIRLKNLIKALDLNQISFASSLGMAQPNISRMISGEGRVSIEVLNRISDRYKQVNLHWLLTGIGEMFLDDLPDKISQVNEDSVPYTGKGRLEELEERLERLEEHLRGSVKKGGK